MAETDSHPHSSLVQDPPTLQLRTGSFRRVTLTDLDTDAVARTGSPRPIFVRGIMQRSGTNYLQDLLALHPDVEPQIRIWEDHLFAHSDLLVRYADLTTSRWHGPVRETDSMRDDLLAALGVGLAHQLAQSITAPWFVTKMPNLVGIGNASLLFPDAPIVVVVRDGRAVVESAVRTFKVPFDREAARWADGARTVLDLARSGAGNIIVVRYEDLVADVEATMSAVLHHIGLDVAAYPFTDAERLPVRGSSELAARGGVHWQAVDRASITLEGRGTSLSDAQAATFDRLAGTELEELGYARAPVRAASGRAARRLAVPSKERLVWSARRAGGRIRRMIRRHL